MNYLNYESLQAVSSQTFQTRQPYPWVSIPETLTGEGYDFLRETSPEVSRFQRFVDVKRAHGQKSHNRYILHYQPDLSLQAPWKEFISELQSPAYLSFLRQTMGLKRESRLILTMEWYYAWQGCAVSPHCDARRKLATHIFYFNTKEDWMSDWGGHILILNDDERYNPHSGPDFDDLKVAAALDARGNESLLFQRTDHSWHGVRPLKCPPDTLRKLFIVTVNIPTFQVWWRQVRGKDPDGYRLVAEYSVP